MTAPAPAPVRTTTRPPIAHLRCDRCETSLCGSSRSDRPATRKAEPCRVCRDVETAYRHHLTCRGTA